MSSQIRVCVIGAGAAGVCAARHLSKPKSSTSAKGGAQDLTNFLPVIYEKSDNVGGIWVYDDINENDDCLSKHSKEPPIKVHSSMYKNMYTNLPKEVMAFPDFPFPSNLSSFLHHTEVKEYLESYVQHFDLERFINYKKEVISVKPFVKEDNKTVWKVIARCTETGRCDTREFDGVMVCNGHYAVPSCPDIPGLDQHFTGAKMHSHFYRIPRPFENKTVLVLGAGASGVDIGIEITKTAKKVYLSHNNRKNVSELPTNMEQIAGVVECNGANSFILSNGSIVDNIDVLFFCTGYKYSFPFLDNSCGIEVTTSMVKPLYKHMININYPSMCFIGLPFQVIPFPQFDLQCQVYTNAISGARQLPGTEVMMKDFTDSLKELKEQGRLLRHYHKMGPLQWAYNKMLARLAGVSEIPKFVENLYKDVHERRTKFLMYYKNDNFIKVLEDGNIVYVRCEDKNQLFAKRR